jgi:hypothetical protein
MLYRLHNKNAGSILTSVISSSISSPIDILYEKIFSLLPTRAAGDARGSVGGAAV